MSAARLIKARAERAQREVDAFNAAHPVGVRVWYWTGLREGEPRVSRTQTPAQVLSGHTAVVWVEGQGSCIALSHVQARPEDDHPSAA